MAFFRYWRLISNFLSTFHLHFCIFTDISHQFTDHKLTSGVHATPEQAVLIHRDIKSRHSLAMHFATFAGSDIEAFEPIVELVREGEKVGVDVPEEFGWIDVGASCVVDVTEPKGRKEPTG